MTEEQYLEIQKRKIIDSAIYLYEKGIIALNLLQECIQNK